MAAITYSLRIAGVQVAPQVGDEEYVVSNVDWVYVGSNGERSTTLGGATSITFLQDREFTPFVALTHDQVANWVLATWPPEQLEVYQNALKAQLSLISPPLPWGS